MDNRNFENNEKEEKVFETNRNVEAQPSYEQKVSSVDQTSFTNSQSRTPQMSMQDAQQQNDANGYNRPEQMPYNGYPVSPQQEIVKYDMYSGGYNNNGQNEPNSPNIYPQTTVGNKKKNGKGVAVIAVALILSLCVGVGGGFLGSYIANDNLASTSETSSSSKDTSKSNDDKDDSVLKITQASDTDTPPTTIQDVVTKVKDSVVEITTETTTYDTFYGQYVQQSAGSGVIISEDGYIITNNHVIDGASDIKIRLTNEKTYEAKLIGKDSTLDVALLKIDEKGLTPATFGNSGKLCVGQTAIVIGNPLGQLGGTVTDGIISALDREIKLEGKTMNLLQTNAAVNPGNSGGGLFDANGNLIGIIVAKSSSSTSGTSVEGLGFAIPVNDVIDILEDLKTKGYVSGKAQLGISYVDVTDQESMFRYRVDKMGVYVSSVNEGSAAEKAGIKIYDCITKVDDEEITESTELREIILSHKAGDKIKLTIYRDGKEMEVDVTLDEKKSDAEESANNEPQTSSYDGYPYFGGGLFF